MHPHCTPSSSATDGTVDELLTRHIQLFVPLMLRKAKDGCLHRFQIFNEP